MLSVCTLKSAGQAANYYNQAEYYTKDGKQSNSEWLGEAASKLGLEGHVDFATFKQLLEGKLPDGTKMHPGYNKKGEPLHRPGYDLTFSAPKSLSILAVVAKDERLLEAHKQSVHAALHHIEQNLAATRIKQNGNISVEYTRNLAFALFQEHDSRLLDPNLHTHCVLLNMTEHNGKWRSIYGDDFYTLKKSLGLQYRIELAQRVMKLGYPVKQTSRDGLFELEGVEKNVLRYFSKRRQEIETTLKTTNMSSQQKVTMTLHKGTRNEYTVNTVASSMANYVTRGKKVAVDQTTLEQRWQEELGYAGTSKEKLEEVTQEAKTRGAIEPPDLMQAINKATPLAIKHLSNKKAVFKTSELQFAIKGLCVASCPNEVQVRSAIEQQVKNNTLVSLEGGKLTTTKALMTEQNNITTMQCNKNTCWPLLPIFSFLAANILLKAPEERDALKLLLSSRDRFVALDAQDEKRIAKVLRALTRTAVNTRCYVIGPKYELAKNFAASFGETKAFSVNGILGYTKRLITEQAAGLKPHAQSSHVWLVQRSHMLSSKDLSSLQSHAEKLNARVVFLGDEMRRGGMDAGSPYRYLIANNINHVKLTGDEKSSLTLLRSQKCQEALTKLKAENLLFAKEDKEERITSAAQYIAQDLERVLLTQNNSEKQAANIAIRDICKKNGALHGQALNTEILAPIPLSFSEKKSIASFQPGDIIRFNRSLQNSDFRQGQYFTITNLDNAKAQLTLENKDGASCKIALTEKLGRKLAVYRIQQREFRCGDIVLWNENTPRALRPQTKIIYNRAVIIDCNKETKELILRFNDHTTCKLNLNEYNHKHLDYGYAQNMYAATKNSYSQGALLVSSAGFPQVTLSDVYTSLSAFNKNGKIFCDNKERLEKALYANSGLTSHAYEQKQVAFTATIEAKPFVQSRQLIEGTLARHNEVLASIIPEEKINKPLSLPSGPFYDQAINAVDYAVTKLTEREAVFSKQSMLDAAQAYDIRIPNNYVARAIDQAVSEKWLIPVGKDGLVDQNNKDLNMFVTKEVYALEQAVLKILRQGEGVMSPVLSGPHPALDFISDHPRLTKSQKQAILMCVTSSDRVNLIQGIAGAGKTTMLKEVKRLSVDAGFEVVGLANTASAKNTLHEKTYSHGFNVADPQTYSHAGIKSQTLASFIIQTEKLIATDFDLARATIPANTILVLDEASLVSVRDMFALLNITEQLNVRAIVMGDDCQQQAIEASRPFHLMLGNSENVAVMNINTRMQTPEALSLMQDVYATRIDDAFDKLLGNLVEIPDREERIRAMATYYLGVSEQDRAEVLPMLPKNADRVLFNDLVRDGLKQGGILTGAEINHNILVAKDLTHPEKSYALSFEAGDWVRFNHNIPRLGIKAGDYLHVTDTTHKEVQMKDQANKLVSWDPQKFAAYFKGAVEVYYSEERNLMVGDQIRWRRNDEDKGIVNSEMAQVLAIKDGKTSVKLQNGNTVDLDFSKKENQHWDYAYGATVYLVQGQDRRNPIGFGEGAEAYTVDSDLVSKGSMVVIPGNEKTNTVSRVGQVVDVNYSGKQTTLTVLDREQKQHAINMPQVKVFPDFEKSRHPASSNMASFLVQATRGDELVMFVNNIEGFKAALADNQDLNKTALEIMLPQEGLKIKENVANMTAEVFGLAKPDELKLQKKSKTTTQNEQSIPKSNVKSPNEITTDQKQSSYILDFNARKSWYQTPRIELADVKRSLEADILANVSAWKGKPDKVSSREARWGKKGSFSVVLSGLKKGTWADFETGAAGKDLISLYMHLNNYSRENFPKVLAELDPNSGLESCSITNGKDHANKNKQNTAEIKTREALATKERIESIKYANKFYKNSSPIQNTLGEKYLREHRGIKGELPPDFRFKDRCWHKELRTYRSALIAPGYDKDGKIQAINRIYLNRDGSKLKEMFTNEAGESQQATDKKCLGPTGSATVFISSDKQTGITFVTEGMENALSIKEARIHDQIISSFGVGQLKNLNIDHNTKTIVLCADHDGLKTNSKIAVLSAIGKWLDEGFKVSIALPFSKTINSQCDFNDLLRHQGSNAVSRSLDQAVEIRNISDLGDKDSPLFKDFLELKTTREQEKIAIKQQERKQIAQQQVLSGLER